MAPFSDEFLFVEMANKVHNAHRIKKICLIVAYNIDRNVGWVCDVKLSVISLSTSMQALFWQQQNYYGVDLTPLYESAHQGYFSHVYPLTTSKSLTSLLVLLLQFVIFTACGWCIWSEIIGGSLDVSCDRFHSDEGIATLYMKFCSTGFREHWGHFWVILFHNLPFLVNDYDPNSFSSIHFHRKNNFTRLISHWSSQCLCVPECMDLLAGSMFSLTGGIKA